MKFCGQINLKPTSLLLFLMRNVIILSLPELVCNPNRQSADSLHLYVILHGPPLRQPYDVAVVVAEIGVSGN